MKLFNLDSPLMKFLSRMTDILWLNILVLIFFLPPGIVYYLFMSHIVAEGAPYVTTGTILLVYGLVAIAAIPIGAAFTGMHYVLLKMVRDEEGYISKDFFKSFKLNFRQASVIWTIAMLLIALLAFDFYSMKTMSQSTLISAAVTVAAIFVYCTLLYVFPVLSHFENSVKGTIKNAFFMSILALPKTVLMAILTAVPVVIIVLVWKFQVMAWLIPLTSLFWFSLPAYYCAKLYDKTFKRFEPESAKPADDMEWTVSATEEGSETNAESVDESADSSKAEGEGDKENSTEA